MAGVVMAVNVIIALKYAAIRTKSSPVFYTVLRAVKTDAQKNERQNTRPKYVPFLSVCFRMLFPTHRFFGVVLENDVRRRLFRESGYRDAAQRCTLGVTP